MDEGTKERLDSWMGKSFGDDLRKLWQWIRDKRSALLVVFGWSVAFAVITLKSYWLVYVENPVLFEQSIMFFTDVAHWIPRLVMIDYVIMIIVSVLAGALLMELDDVLYGWIASIFLSFFLSVILILLFVWYPLGAGNIFSQAGTADRAVIPLAELMMVNVFRMWFPLVPVISLITVFCGALVRSYISE